MEKFEEQNLDTENIGDNPEILDHVPKIEEPALRDLNNNEREELGALLRQLLTE